MSNLYVIDSLLYLFQRQYFSQLPQFALFVVLKFHLLVEKRKLVFGCLVVAARTYLQLNLNKVKLFVVVTLVIELTKFYVVLIATAKTNVELRLKFSLKSFSLTVMIVEDDLVFKFCTCDWSANQFNKNSEIIFMFGLSFHHFWVALVSIIFDGFDSFGIYFQPQC